MASGNADEYTNWLLDSTLPTLIEFSEEHVEGIFGKQNNAIILFRANSDAGANHQAVFNEAAKKFKGQSGMPLFVVSDINDGIQKRLAEFVGIS